MKPSFKKAVKIYKKQFWKFFLVDFIFLLISLLFVLYAKLKVDVYMLALNQYKAQVLNLQALVQQGTPDALVQVNVLLEAMSPLINRITLFMFFVVPAIVFVLWCFFQSIHYNVIDKRKLFNSRKLLVFGLVSLPFYVVLLLLAERFFESSIGLLTGGMSVWLLLLLYVVIGIILVYVLQVVYALYLKYGVKELINKSLIVAFKNFHRIFFFVLVYLFVFAFVFASIFEIVLKSVVMDYWGIVIGALAFIGSVLVLGFLRTFLVIYIKKFV